MTVTILTGSEASTDNTSNNPRDMQPIILLEPSAAPLTALLNKLNSSPAKNPKIEYCIA